MHDLFDTNDYAGDSRIDFLNWSIWAAGAFDYPADRVGLTYGITAELNQPHWAARAGYFLVGNEPNSNVFDMNLFARGGYVAELELRFKPYDRPGTAKVGVWLTSTFAGSYNEAVTLALATGRRRRQHDRADAAGPHQVRLLSSTCSRRSPTISALFARWSWNDGHTEIMAFTDIDASLSLGMRLKGTRWGRPDDEIGMAGALNMLSADQSRYLAAGGLGVLVGDGRLSYAAEKVVEAYYAFQLTKGLIATADYQLLIDPAYNADRGPVHVFAGRLRASF